MSAVKEAVIRPLCSPMLAVLWKHLRPLCGNMSAAVWQRVGGFGGVAAVFRRNCGNLFSLRRGHMLVVAAVVWPHTGGGVATQPQAIGVQNCGGVRDCAFHMSAVMEATLWQRCGHALAAVWHQICPPGGHMSAVFVTTLLASSAVLWQYGGAFAATLQPGMWPHVGGVGGGVRSCRPFLRPPSGRGCVIRWLCVQRDLSHIGRHRGHHAAIVWTHVGGFVATCQTAVWPHVGRFVRRRCCGHISEDVRQHDILCCGQELAVSAAAWPHVGRSCGHTSPVSEAKCRPRLRHMLAALATVCVTSRPS